MRPDCYAAVAPYVRTFDRRVPDASLRRHAKSGGLAAEPRLHIAGRRGRQQPGAQNRSERGLRPDPGESVVPNGSASARRSGAAAIVKVLSEVDQVANG